MVSVVDVWELENYEVAQGPSAVKPLWDVKCGCSCLLA